MPAEQTVLAGARDGDDARPPGHGGSSTARPRTAYRSISFVAALRGLVREWHLASMSPALALGRPRTPYPRGYRREHRLIERVGAKVVSTWVWMRLEYGPPHSGRRPRIRRCRATPELDRIERRNLPASHAAVRRRCPGVFVDADPDTSRQLQASWPAPGRAGPGPVNKTFAAALKQLDEHASPAPSACSPRASVLGHTSASRTAMCLHVVPSTAKDRMTSGFRTRRICRLDAEKSRR
jgi:hypothetical protein